MRASGDAARARERPTDALFRLGRDLVAVTRTADVLKRGVRHIAGSFDAHVVALLVAEGGRLEPVIAQGGPARLDAKEMAVAQWALANGQPAGHGTDTLPTAAGRYVPLAAGDHVLGVVALFRPQALTRDEAHHLDAFVHPVALALRRSDLGAWIGGGPPRSTGG